MSKISSINSATFAMSQQTGSQKSSLANRDVCFLHLTFRRKMAQRLFLNTGDRIAFSVGKGRSSSFALFVDPWSILDDFRRFRNLAEWALFHHHPSSTLSNGCRVSNLLLVTTNLSIRSMLPSVHTQAFMTTYLIIFRRSFWIKTTVFVNRP